MTTTANRSILCGSGAEGVRTMTADLARVDATRSRSAPVQLAGAVVVAWARFSDLPALARLQRRGFTHHHGYGLLTLASLWLAPRVLILVARAGNAPAGMIIADERRGRTAHGRILNICVDPRYRRLGIARDLMLTAEALLPPRRMVLMVDQKNDAAIALYTSLGYRDVGLTPDYYGPHRHGVMMQKG